MTDPSPRHLAGNWARSDLPFLRKVAVAVRNNVKKAVTLSHCCGNPGQPGC